MPIKDMNESFRNRKGIYYKSIGDFCEPDTMDEDSKKELKKYRETGLKAFREKYKDYYFRVFVETGNFAKNKQEVKEK